MGRTVNPSMRRKWTSTGQRCPSRSDGDIACLEENKVTITHLTTHENYNNLLKRRPRGGLSDNFCQRCILESGEIPTSKKIIPLSGFNTRAIPFSSSTMSGIVPSVNVLTTISTVHSRKGIRSSGRPRHSIFSFVRRFVVLRAESFL